MKSRRILSSLLVAAIAIGVGVAVLTNPGADVASAESGASDFAIFRRSANLTNAEVAERDQVFDWANGNIPKEDFAGVSREDLRAVDVPGGNGHAWLAPTSDDGLAIFVPAVGNWAYARASWAQLSEDGAVVLSRVSENSSVAVVVGASNIKTPTIVRAGQTKSETAPMSNNVTTASLNAGDSIVSGSTRLTASGGENSQGLRAAVEAATKADSANRAAK